MRFNSRICTTKEQSERLIALGLKKETADCQYAALVVDWKGNSISNPKWCFYNHNKGFIVQNFERMERIPTWSLNRLIEILPKRIKNLKEGWDICGHDIVFVITEELDVNYEEPFEDEPCYNKYFTKGNLYDKIIDCIEWLITEGYFNKEYLEE